MADDFLTNHKTETFKSLIVFSSDAFKALILINGGAAAGMVATIDKLGKALSHAALQGAMLCFVLGLVCALIATFLGYVTQNRLHNENMGAISNGAHVKYVRIAFSFCVLSLVLFCAGGLIAALGLRRVAC